MSHASGSAWTRNFYPRDGDGVGFDRVVFFSDAVFAIALTLAAVEIGLPEVDAGESGSVTALWHALAEKGGLIAGFLVAFAWVAIYWRANHRFTTTLAGMSGGYIGAVLVYLALIAFLPIPAATLGEYWGNPLAVVLFAAYGTAVSGMEIVMLLVANRSGLFVAAPSDEFLRMSIVGAAIPMAGFLTSIPLAFVSAWLPVLWWFVVAMVGGYLVNRFLAADPPADPVG